MATKIIGLSKSEGMKQFSFVLPEGDYLLVIEDVEIEGKKDASGKLIAYNYKINCIVDNAENLPDGVSADEVIGKSYTEFLYVMTPEHPKFSNPTKSGSVVGMIGIDRLKSFLDACAITIKKDTFNEKKLKGAAFEATVGLREYKDKEGKKREGNKINEYRLCAEEEAEEEELVEVAEEPEVEALPEEDDDNDGDDFDDDFDDDDDDEDDE